MIRCRRPVLVLTLLAACLLSGCGYEEKGARIAQAITDDVQPIAGVTAVDPHVNANTSGTFITVGVTAGSHNEDELKGILTEALTKIAKDPRIEGGTFAIGVFSPDKAINIGPSDIGCTSATGTLDSIRACFP